MKKTILSIFSGIGIALAAFTSFAATADTLPTFEKAHTAIVITDPQNDFLSENGKLYGLVKPNMDRLDTIRNIETLMKLSKEESVSLAVDPLVYTKIDLTWANAGALQRQLLDMKALYANTMDMADLEGSGADFYAPFKKYIYDDETIRVAPHKMYGPESNDLIYQLRSRGIDTVILGGLVANLCVDSHMRTLMENGFKVYVVKDAVAAPSEEAYSAALVNYGMIASGVMTTEGVVKALR